MREFPHFKTQFARRLKEQEMSLGRLSKLTGLARPTLSRIASGDANPTLSSLVAVAGCLGISVAQLLGPQQRPVSTADGTDSLLAALVSVPPSGDDRSLAIYEKICRGESQEEIRREVESLHYCQPGESVEDAITRAVLDVFYDGRVWVDQEHLPRDEKLETRLAKKFDLKPKNELQGDPAPVRVIDLPPCLHYLVRLHALGAVAAALVKKLLRHYGPLGFSDGFLAATVLRFLRRGDLTRTEIVPLVYTPGLTQAALSGATLTGSLSLCHHGYAVRSTGTLEELQYRIEKVRLAITSCGPAERESYSRLVRLIRDTLPRADLQQFFQQVSRKHAVGDLMYHFLKADGQKVNMPWVGDELENVDVRRLRHRREEDPLIYTASLERLENIAEHGVALLVVHSENRAAVARAALLRKRKPINFVVTTSFIARKILSGK